MKFNWVGHACVILEHQGFRLMTDPWFGYPLNAYYPVPEFCPPEPQVLAAIDAIHISHIHGDHFCPRSLAHFSKDTPVFISRYGTRYFYDRILNLGFKTVVEVSPGVRGQKVGPFELFTFQKRQFDGTFDSALMVKANDRLYYLNNDCTLDPFSYKSIVRCLGDIDGAFLGYNRTGPFPACYDWTGFPKPSDCPGEDMTADIVRDSQLESLRQAVVVSEELRPKWIVPYANGLRFRNRDLVHLNRHFNQPQDLAAALKGTTQVLEASAGSTIDAEGARPLLSGARSDAKSPEAVALPERYRCDADEESLRMMRPLLSEFLFRALGEESRSWVTPMWIKVRIKGSQSAIDLAYAFDGARMLHIEETLPGHEFDMIIEYPSSAIAEVLRGQSTLLQVHYSFGAKVKIQGFCHNQLRVEKWQSLAQVGALSPSSPAIHTSFSLDQ